MRTSPSTTLISLDSPSMSFRSSDRALWPARHFDEYPSLEVLGERHTPIQSHVEFQQSRSAKHSPFQDSPSVKVDISVAATRLQPDHILILFTPGISLFVTAGSGAQDAVEGLVKDDTLLQQEQGPASFACSYVVRDMFSTILCSILMTILGDTSVKGFREPNIRRI